MKRSLITAILSLIYLLPLIAQKSRPAGGQPIGGIVVKTKKTPGINVSLSANGGSSSSGGLSKNISFNPDLNLELCWGGFGIGLDAGIFNTKPDFDFNRYSLPLKNIDMIAVSNTRKNWTSAYFLAGPQYTFGTDGAVHKISFTVSLKAGIGLNKAADLFIIDKEMNQEPIAKYSVPSSYKQNDFAIKPAVKITYWLSEKLAIHANVQYLSQTGGEEFNTGYRDLSKVDFSAGSDAVRKQIQAQPFISTKTKGPDRYFSAGIGITYNIRKLSKRMISSGKSISEKGVSSTKGRPKSRVSVEGDDGLSQSETEARDKVKNVRIKITGAGDKAGELALTNQQLEKLFTPLASEGCTYQTVSIIAYKDTDYLVAVFENATTKMKESIGLILHKNTSSSFISGGDKPIKCGFNLYCTCNPPLCLGCTRPGGTTVEQCGFAKSGSVQLISYFAAFADIGIR